MKRKTYVATADYGKRNSELDKRVMQFGNHSVTLYRRPDALRSSWYFRIHIKEEKRHYRQSLKTHDLNQAKSVAQEQVINILSKVRSGERILDLSLADLKRKFELHMDSEVEKDQISYNTWKNHRYRITLGLEFLKTKYPKGLETRLSQIDGNVFNGYLDWRLTENKAKGRSLRRDVARDELLIIRKMFTFAQKQKLCSAKTLPNWDFHVEAEGPKRERITAANHAQFKNALRKWTITDPAVRNNEKMQYHRWMTLSVIGLVEASGMRSGEVFGLKNRDIQRKGDIDFLVRIRKETSKVRRGREITVRSFQLHKWLEEWQKHNDPNDFVFTPFDTGKTTCRDTFYHQYKSLRQKLKEKGLEWFDLYHSRHAWVTNRILAGEDIYQVAQAAGTSVAEIESTYSHVLTAETTRKFNRKRVEHHPDGSHEIVPVIELTKEQKQKRDEEIADQIKQTIAEVKEKYGRNLVLITPEMETKFKKQERL
jgi:integrase